MAPGSFRSTPPLVAAHPVYPESYTEVGMTIRRREIKIRRAPGMKEDWKLIATIEPADYAERWVSGRPIELNADIVKDPKKRTDFRLEIDEDDVLALFDAIVERYREMRKSQEEAEDLQEALTKIDSLICHHSEEAPSKDALIQAVQVIAGHFSRSVVMPREKPEVGWIKWNSII